MTDDLRAWRTHQSVLNRQARDGSAYPSECAGVLRVEDDDPGWPMVVVCDGCGERLGVFRGDGPRPRDVPGRDRDRRSSRHWQERDDGDDPLLGAT